MRGQAVHATVKELHERDTKRRAGFLRSIEDYGNMEGIGLNGFALTTMPNRPKTAIKERVTYNVIQSCVDSITSKISKNKPKPLFLTNMGKWEQQRKAKKLNQFVEGLFYQNNAYELGVQVFRDGAITSDGLIHVYKDLQAGKICYERTLQGECYTDWLDGFYGQPRQFHRAKNIDRDVLIDTYPSSKRIIKTASTDFEDTPGREGVVSDQLTVIESWHLRSGPDATDGLHCITLNNETLFEEEWKYDFFPFAKFQWGSKTFGYWGQGLAEQLRSQQIEINKILWVMQRSMHLAGSFKILIENGSKIVKEHLNNDIGAIITYTGSPPTYITPPAFPEQYFQRWQDLKSSCYEQAGISMLSAASQKPAGLNSGKALREFNDIESDRFMTIGHQYEQLYLDLARCSVAFGKELYEADDKFQVQVPGKKFIKTIPWAKVDLEDDEYYLKMYPISSLPSDPAGRLETIQEWMQAGLVSPRQGRRLLDFPDIDMIEDLQNAEEDYLHEIMEKMMDDDPEEPGTYTAPEPEDDLKLARELALEYYAQGKRDQAPEERLELLRTFMNQITLLEQKALPPPAAPGMPGAPQAVPAPEPQSNMLPNVPGAQPINPGPTQ